MTMTGKRKASGDLGDGKPGQWVWFIVTTVTVMRYTYVGLYTKYKTHLSKDKLFIKLLQAKV